MTIEFSTETPGTTRRLGERIGRRLRAGDVVLLSGELGAGKTVLAQGIARGLSISVQVKSSSFVIMNQYEGRVTLYHADLYRLESGEEVAELALPELAADGVLLVEWPERAPAGLPEEHLLATLAYDGAKRRRITLEASGERYDRLLAALRPRARG